MQVSEKSDQPSKRRCAKDKNERWSTAAIFVDRAGLFSACDKKTSRGTSQTSVEKIRPVVLEENKKMSTDRRTYRQTDAGFTPVRKALPGLRPEELLIRNRYNRIPHPVQDTRRENEHKQLRRLQLKTAHLSGKPRGQVFSSRRPTGYLNQSEQTTIDNDKWTTETLCGSSCFSMW